MGRAITDMTAVEDQHGEGHQSDGRSPLSNGSEHPLAARLSPGAGQHSGFESVAGKGVTGVVEGRPMKSSRRSSHQDQIADTSSMRSLEGWFFGGVVIGPSP